MKKLTSSISIMFLMIAITWMGCESTTSVSEDEMVSAIMELVESDSTITLDGIGDGGAIEEEYEYDGELIKAVMDTFPESYWLVRFGRKLSGQISREFDVEVEGDSAYVMVTTTMTGDFKVVLLDTANHTIEDSISKPFTQISKQQILVRRFRRTDNPRRNWRVIGFSPILSRSVGNTIEITDLLVESDSNDFSLSLSNDSEDSILDRFLSRDELPVLRPWQRYHVELGVSNPDPFYYEPGEGAIVHYGLKRHILKFRRPLRDPENDDTFEGYIRIHRGSPRMCRIFFDLIDLASIFDTDAPFNSVFWALPYRARHNQHQ